MMKPVPAKYPPGTLFQNVYCPNIFRVCLGWHVPDGEQEESNNIDTISPTEPRWFCSEEFLDKYYRIIPIIEESEYS